MTELGHTVMDEACAVHKVDTSRELLASFPARLVRRRRPHPMGSFSLISYGMVIDDLKVRTHSRACRSNEHGKFGRFRDGDLGNIIDMFPGNVSTNYLQCHQLSRSIVRKPDSRGAAVTEFVNHSVAPICAKMSPMVVGWKPPGKYSSIGSMFSN